MGTGSGRAVCGNLGEDDPSHGLTPATASRLTPFAATHEVMNSEGLRCTSEPAAAADATTGAGLAGCGSGIARSLGCPAEEAFDPLDNTV